MTSLRQIACKLVFIGLLIGCSRNYTVTGAESAASYLYGLSRPAGGFAAPHDTHPSLEATAAAMVALERLNAPSPCKKKTAAYLASLGMTAATLNEVHRYVTATVACGIEVDRRVLRHLVALQDSSGGWPNSDGKLSLESTYHAVAALTASGEQPHDPQAVARFIVSRLHRDGRFSDVPRDSSDTAPTPSHDHILLTYCGVSALQRLGYDIPWKQAIASWIMECQNEDGGFRWNPDVPSPSDMWYAALALRALSIVGATPSDSVGAVAWINSCRTPDGGFSSRQGWQSDIIATSEAIIALDALTSAADRAIASQTIAVKGTRRDASFRYKGLQSVYRGPVPGDDVGKSAWVCGLPAYYSDDGIETAVHFLTRSEIGVLDSVLTDYVMIIPMPPVGRILSNGQAIREPFHVWMTNGSHPDTVETLRRIWDAVSKVDTPLSWDEIVTDFIRPLTERGALVTMRASTGDRVADYLRYEPLLDRSRPQGVMVERDESALRRFPWMYRVVTRMPCAPPYAPDRSNEARLVWASDDGTFQSLREAVEAGNTAIAFPTGDTWTFVRGTGVLVVRQNPERPYEQEY